jgi:acetyl-CoA C-acetyltransferase
MLETAENLRRDFSISREEQDEFAARSHRRAARAQAEGLFRDEIVPVTLKTRKGEVSFAEDEHIRPDTTVESLAALRPIMGKADPGATVTAGNASGQNDVGWGAAGVAPDRMGIGPVPAVARAFARTGLAMSDMDLVELNEAFAAQVLACTKSWDFAPADYDRLNVNGSGISLGHPVGATGVRILATMLRELERRGARYGLETMCIGGGQGLAAIFERV